MSGSILERFMNGELNMNDARSQITRMVSEQPANAWGTALNLAGQDHYSREREGRLYDRNQTSGQSSPTFNPVADELAYQISSGTFHGPQPTEPFQPDPIIDNPVVNTPTPTPMPSYNDYTFNNGGGGNNLW
ncbi:MAG: hypothetical protein GY822_18385 [Deltaproteobacteria bacterium]|nr:hypothetical protein [Deltaproteobacteria bacterium]